MADVATQLAELLGKNADLFAAYGRWSDGQIMLLAGTIDDPNSFDKDGGKSGALGFYPVVNVNGQTIYVPCMARLTAMAAGSADPAALEALLGKQVTVALDASRQATAAATQAVGTLADKVNRAAFIPVFADESITTVLAVDAAYRVYIGVDALGALIAPAPQPVTTSLVGRVPVFADESVSFAAVVDPANGVIFGAGATGRVIAPGFTQQIAPVFADEGWLLLNTDAALGVISGVKADGTAFPASALISPPVAISIAPIFADEGWLLLYTDAALGIISGVKVDGTAYPASVVVNPPSAIPITPIFADEAWLTATVAADFSIISGVRADGTAFPASGAPYSGWTSYISGAGAVALLSTGKGFRIAKAVGTVRPAPAVSNVGLVTWADDQGSALPEFRQFSLAGGKAVPATITRLVMIPQMGQSNGIGSGGFPAVTRTPVRRGRAFTFTGGSRVVQPDAALGNWEQGAADNNGQQRVMLDQQIVALTDMQEADVYTGKNLSWYGETSISGMAWALTAALSAEIGVLGATFAIGGASLAQQAPNSAMFNNVLRAVERAKAFCDLLGIVLEVPAVLWNQGEADRAGDPATYRSNWRALQAALTTSINAITGGTGEVVIVFDQNASWTQSLAVGVVPVAQLAEALANPTRFQMAMPQYVSGYRTDGIHLDNASYRKRGEYEGRALAKVRTSQMAGTPLTATTTGALFVTGAAVNGTQLTISTSATSQLVLDTAFVTDPGQYGLRVFDGSGAEIALSNIAVSGASQITATFASALTAGTAYTLGVADKGMVGAKAGRTTGPRACFRDSSADLGSDGAALYNWAAVQQFQIQ